MIFNSVTYIVFLIVVVSLYWTLPRRPRLWLLFLASLMFYGFWRVEFIPLLMLSTVTDYLVALRLDAVTGKLARKALLLVSLSINLGLLFCFKYLIFFTENAWGLMHWMGVEAPMPTLNIILPLGISFYTFQTISYTADVYRRIIKPERDFILYGSYVIFFPQLVAGPILRAGEVLPQLTDRPPAELSDFAVGVRRVLYGLFLKVVLADNIAPWVDQGFAGPAGVLGALDVWTLSFLFGFQIYFDFCAYSHIAIGSARLMGIHFPENFNFPYMASSPRDFWQRWHISLSSWIRDYLYLPLTGAQFQDRSVGGLATATDATANQVTEGGRRRALFLTWAIMGLWHGAAWSFMFWGIYHAVFITTYRLLAPHCVSLPLAVRRWGGWLVTLPVAMLSWVFFRAESLPQAFTMYGKILNPLEYGHLELRENTYLIAAMAMIALLLAYLVRTKVWPQLRRLPWLELPLETAQFAIVTLGVFLYLRPISQFIYFQF